MEDPKRLSPGAPAHTTTHYWCCLVKCSLSSLFCVLKNFITNWAQWSTIEHEQIIFLYFIFNIIAKNNEATVNKNTFISMHKLYDYIFVVSNQQQKCAIGKLIYMDFASGCIMLEANKMHFWLIKCLTHACANKIACMIFFLMFRIWQWLKSSLTYNTWQHLQVVVHAHKITDISASL